ncbi:MAG: hypothetical protein SGPRY_008294 [Prymnesium sp.]
MPSSRSPVGELASAMGGLSAEMRGALRLDAAVWIHRHSRNASADLWCWTTSPAPCPIRLADVRRGGGELGGCNLGFMSLHGATADERQSLLFDLSLVLQLIAGNILVLSGSTRCLQHRERYLASFYSTFNEQCWIDQWSAHEREGLFLGASCVEDEGVRIGLDTVRWCVARVSNNSVCEQGDEAWRGTCVPSELVVFQGMRKAWVHPKYGVPSLRHQQNRHFRYYSIVECNPTSGSGLASEEEKAYGNGRNRSRGVCLLFKDDVFETWIGGGPPRKCHTFGILRNFVRTQNTSIAYSRNKKSM